MGIRQLAVVLVIAALGSVSMMPASAGHGTTPAIRAHPDGSHSDDSVTAWSTKCRFIGSALLDPVKHHGQTIATPQRPLSDHLHIFFGSLTSEQFSHLDNRVDNAQLREMVQTNYSAGAAARQGLCNPPDQKVHCDPDNAGGHRNFCLNGSLYWFPALFADTAHRFPPAGGTPVIAPPRFSMSYYRNEDVNPNPATESQGGQMNPLPANLSMVGGDSMAMQGQGIDVMEWSCVQGVPSGQDGIDGNQGSVHERADHLPNTCWYDHDAMVDHTKFPYLRAIVEFPNCIETGYRDGASFNWYNASTANHMATAGDSGLSGSGPGWHDFTKACDADHDQAIPTLGLGIRWRLDATYPGTGEGVWGCVDEYPLLPPYPDIQPSQRDDHWYRCDLSGASLASDPAVPSPDMRGVTGHADFMNGWLEDDMNSLIHACYYDYEFPYWIDRESHENGDAFYHKNINCGAG